jgi:predicted amidophosphoribosyltransferase
MKKWTAKGSACPSCGQKVIFGTKVVMCPECKNEWKYDKKVP